MKVVGLDESNPFAAAKIAQQKELARAFLHHQDLLLTTRLLTKRNTKCNQVQRRIPCPARISEFLVNRLADTQERRGKIRHDIRRQEQLSAVRQARNRARNVQMQSSAK